MDVKTIKTKKNKRGEIKTKVVRITNKKSHLGLAFDSINDLYQGMLTKFKAKDITIIARHMDNGFTTLKSRQYLGDNLVYADEDYYNSLPKDVGEWFRGTFYSIDVTVNL
jgi:hypothetical protein